MILRWKDKRFEVDHPDIIGFSVHEAENVLGEKSLSLCLLRTDGSGVPLHEWWRYDVAVS